MHYREHNFPLCHSMHRRPAAHSPVGSGRGGSGAVVTRQQEAQINRMAELPALIMQHVVALLDHGSRLELRKADKRCRQMVDSCWRLVCVPLAQLRRHDMDGLARRFAATSCFVISEPEQRVSLSRLGHRRRCEHLLAVFLDNTAPWPHLVALDLSAAIASLSPASLELLAASLPGLQHLALPKVAASSEFAHAPAHEVLHLLGRLQQLLSLEFDCSFLQGGSSSAAASCITSPRGQHLPSYGGISPVAAAAAVAMTPQLGTLQQHQQHAGASTAGAASSSRAAAPAPPTALNLDTGSDAPQQQPPMDDSSNSHDDSNCSTVAPQQQEYYASHLCNPWLQLQHLQQLQQLQLVNPCGSVQEDLLPALAGLRGLRSLALVKVQQALFEQLLDPGQGLRCGKGLGQLRHLAGLTRLELGLQQPCSCKGSEALLPATLIIPPHNTSDVSSPTAAAATASSSVSSPSTAPAAAGQPPPAHHQQQICRSHVQQHTCCWSHLAQLRVLVLSGVSLDCPLLAATADCSRLSELHVAGLQLEDDEFGPDFGGLKALKVLAVSQRFSMGGHCAAALFPGLAELSIRDDGSSCPDLLCLKHHSCLRSLAIEAGGPGWQLSSLQLAHLVHIDSLRQLSLASRGGAPAHAPPHAAAHGHGHGSVQLGGHVSPARSHPRLMSPGGGSSGGCNSHWLPTASLSQVTLLTLSGPCNDHTLSQLPSQFPGLVSLQLLGSYYASDWGLKRLCKAPQLSALLLDGCEHVTEYGLEVLIRGGGIKVLVVNECSGVDERACQRIRRACRNSCTCLHWHGTDDSRSSHGSHSSLSTSGSGYISPFFDSQASHSQQQQHHHHHHPCLDSAAAGTGGGGGSGSCNTSCHSSRGSAFLERCWREAERAGRDSSSSSSTTCDNESSSCSNNSGIVSPADRSKSRIASPFGACSQISAPAEAANVAAGGASSSKALVLRGLARVSLTADASPSTPRQTEAHRNIGSSSSSSSTAFDLQQQPELASSHWGHPWGAGSSRLQAEPAAAEASRSAPVTMACSGYEASSSTCRRAAVQSSGMVSGVVASSAESGQPRVDLCAGRSHSTGSRAADQPAAAAAAAAAAAPGVTVERISSSGAGGAAAGSRVRRSSCVDASQGEISLGAAGVPRWPRHSHPGPAYAH
uniref:F-box domain-containing protein n=1 Tax=Tetradesmus obliquus TaxID=3088 RepID=A0A383W353_TETOB|eukprot:jgi/Sobl393_1/5234/SZX71603.1